MLSPTPTAPAAALRNCGQTSAAPRRGRLPPGARKRLESADAFASPIVELELTHLYEIGRVSEPALAALHRSIGLEVAGAPLLTADRAILANLPQAAWD